jgi:hypothetical protein
VNRLLARLVAVFAIFATVAVSAASPALADGRYEKYFSFESSTFSATDRYGSFNAQVSIFSVGHPMAWSFRLAPQLQAIATTPMTCTAQGWDSNYLPTGYFDRHVDIPVDYLWHSTIRNEPWDQDRTLTGSCVFRVNPPGTATVSWQFNYEISQRGLVCSPNCPRVPARDADGAFESAYSVAYDQ